MKNLIKNLLREALAPDYKSWKRKNLTLRGIKNENEFNGGSAILGDGLYTASLGNKQTAKGYGTVYFVVGAIPKNPKIFNSLNDWEIWFYNSLVFQYSKAKGKDFPDKRDFNQHTTIEKEMIKLGYDGIIIKGREMVNYKPENILYFKTENQLINYYNHINNIYEETKNVISNDCIKIPINKEVIDFVSKFDSPEQLLRNGGLPIDMLDRLAFGFSDSDITELPPSKLSIKWNDDLENVKYEVKKSGLSPINWSKKINLSEPIDVSFEKNKFYIEDGHHRYYAAKTLNKLLKINLEIKTNPIVKLSSLGYDDFHKCLFKQINSSINEQMIDGQNMNQGTQTACNKMSVATYKEGIKLIIDAIGTPQENPDMWKKIAKPLKNWQEEDFKIGQEVNTGGMSGDSMVDESNTWWAAIQSTICEQGSDFE